MPLYRPHRGMLSDALSECVIVKDIHDLCRVIQKDLSSWGDIIVRPESLLITDHGFDARTGWYTQMVKSDITHAGQSFGVHGFLSEPFTPAAAYFSAPIDVMFDPKKFKLIPNEIIPFLNEPDFGDTTLSGKIEDFKLGSAYSGSYKTRRMCYEIDIRMESNKWLEGLPFIHWPSHYLIKVTPPFGAKVIRFRLKSTDTPHELSIYLDGYNFSGCMPWPHYEIYGGLGDDCSRCKWDDTEELLRLVHCHFYGFPKDEE